MQQVPGPFRLLARTAENKNAPTPHISHSALQIGHRDMQRAGHMAGGELAVRTSSTVGRTDRINSEAVAASTAPTADTSNAAAGTARTKTAHKASITDRKTYGANMKGSFADKTKETTAPLPLSKRRRAPEGSPSAAHPPKKSRSWSQGKTRPARGC